MSAKLLAKLTPHGIQITGEGFGGVIEVSESDVAAALAGLDRPVYEFMRLKFCADRLMLSSVIEGVARKIVFESFRDDRDPGIKLSISLATIAVHQATEGPLCSTCNGTGTYRYKDCQGCAGTGRRHMSLRQCAKMAGVSHKTYRRDWELLVNFYVSLLQGYESAGLRHVYSRLVGHQNQGVHSVTSCV